MKGPTNKMKGTIGDLESVINIRNNRAKNVNLPKKKGIYKWWCKKDLIKNFLLQLDLNNKSNEIIGKMEQSGEYYCFYVGQTKSEKGLAGRIKSQHIGKQGKANPNKGSAIGSSTLRRSINALKNGGRSFDEDYVDNILNNCLVEWKALEEDEINEEEKKQINSNLRLFNLDDLDNANKGKGFIKLREEIISNLKTKRK